MHLLALLPLAALALGIPYAQPEETARSAQAPARAPMARRAIDTREARARVEALAKAQADVRAMAVYARQNGATDYEPLLHLASLAGIPLPTDPGALLGLAPAASKLLQALPTPPVLTALETAAPSGFISQIVHDPSFAASFESAFAAGSSPSWFLALPTDIRAYLHSYNGLPTVAGALGTVIASVTKAESQASESAKTAIGGKNSTITTASASQTGGINAGSAAPSSQSAAASAVSSASSAGAGAAAAPTNALASLGLGVAAALAAAVAL